MSAKKDAIIAARGFLKQCVVLEQRLDVAVVNATLAHAGGRLDDATRHLAWADTVLDALCKQVELCRIAVAREHELLQPTQSEEVAA